MLVVSTALHGYEMDATDGKLGSVKDFLFDDRSWQCRWLVIETGSWLTGRKVLIHPSALGSVDHERRLLPVQLTRQQVEYSPRIEEHQPVSAQAQEGQFKYYGWDPYWDADMIGIMPGGWLAGGSPNLSGDSILMPEVVERLHEEADPNLRSLMEVTTYHVHATDGDLGHVHDTLIDDASFRIRYLILDTSDWWAGQRVLMSPSAITLIDEIDRKIVLDVTRETVKASPTWDPISLIDEEMETRLRNHYNWPGSRGGGLDSPFGHRA